MIEKFDYETFDADRKAGYYEYLQSQDWAVKRNERLKIDNFTCQICGAKEHLHVHHITYENVYNEDIGNDLITVCKRCHEVLHKGIDEYKQQGASHLHDRNVFLDEVRSMQMLRFCEAYEKLDYSSNGNVNFCDMAVIKEYMAKGGGFPFVSVLDIENYFILKRRLLIKKWIESGYTAREIQKRSKFSQKMIQSTVEKMEKGEI